MILIRASVIALLSLTSSMPVAATSIVVVAQKDVVLVATDTLSTELKSDSVATYSSCKIHIESNFVFASAGNIRLTGDAGSFDVTALVHSIASETTDVKSVVARFAEKVQRPLELSMKLLHKLSPDKLPPGPALSTVFVEFHGEQSVIYLLNFKARIDADSVSISYESRTHAPEHGSMKLFMGVSEEMSAYDRLHPEWLTSDTVAGMNHLITLEITAHPDKVGPPIDILLIQAASRRWIQGNDKCTESGHRAVAP